MAKPLKRAAIDDTTFVRIQSYENMNRVAKFVRVFHQEFQVYEWLKRTNIEQKKNISKIKSTPYKIC